MTFFKPLLIESFLFPVFPVFITVVASWISIDPIQFNLSVYTSLLISGIIISLYILPKIKFDDEVRNTTLNFIIFILSILCSVLVYSLSNYASIIIATYCLCLREIFKLKNFVSLVVFADIIFFVVLLTPERISGQFAWTVGPALITLLYFKFNFIKVSEIVSNLRIEIAVLRDAVINQFFSNAISILLTTGFSSNLEIVLLRLFSLVDYLFNSYSSFLLTKIAKEDRNSVIEALTVGSIKFRKALSILAVILSCIAAFINTTLFAKLILDTIKIITGYKFKTLHVLGQFQSLGKVQNFIIFLLILFLISVRQEYFAFVLIFLAAMYHVIGWVLVKGFVNDQK